MNKLVVIKDKGIYRLIILVIACLLFTHVKAQPKAGDFTLGGRLSFNRQQGQLPSDPANGTETKNFFRLSPQIGTFLNKRIEVGFFTLVEYEGVSSVLTLQDSLNRNINIDTRRFDLQFEFGFSVKYYQPIRSNLYWVNSLQPSWGTFVSGDRLVALFETDRPQQNRRSFISTNWITQLQYFAKPNLSVSIGLSPLRYTYTYNTIERFNQPDTEERGHRLSFDNIATGLFIGVNLLIIAEDEE